jgi:hypothetical protein
MTAFFAPHHGHVIVVIFASADAIAIGPPM